MNAAEFFSNFKAILPLIVPILSGIVLLLASSWISPHRRWLAPLWTALTLLVALVLLFWPARGPVSAFGSMVFVDGFGIFLGALFLLNGLASVALSVDYFRCSGECRSEYYILMLLSVAGMMLMAVAVDLIVFFLALELLSLPLYTMAASACRRTQSEEAALKYFLMGAFAGGFVLYGTALIFGATGTTNLSDILIVYQAGAANLPLLAIGAGLLLVGFGFKVAAVPFHMWTPDVYQGAPAAVTAFMSVGAKAAGFAALLRIFVYAFSSALGSDLAPAMWVLAALTMLLGNLAAMAQGNIKRMLAYSSIAHAGYLLMPLVAIGVRGQLASATVAILFYLLVYAISSLGAWAVVIAVEKEDGSGVAIDDFAGLRHRAPLLAASMAVFMFSLIGMPPLLGFVGKFYLFGSVLGSGQPALALVGLVASLVSAVYYLRVVVVMFMREGAPEVNDAPLVKLTAAVMALAALIMPIFATPIFNWLWRLILNQ
ncbi:MAG: NADH-quinone oxidoreductase subunit N [Chloroflexota bacterium]